MLQHLKFVMYRTGFEKLYILLSVDLQSTVFVEESCSQLRHGRQYLLKIIYVAQVQAPNNDVYLFVEALLPTLRIECPFLLRVQSEA